MYVSIIGPFEIEWGLNLPKKYEYVHGHSHWFYPKVTFHFNIARGSMLDSTFYMAVRLTRKYCVVHL